MKMGNMHECKLFSLLTILLAFTFCLPIASETVLLENGLHVSISENKGDALIHIQFSVNAGRNMQLAHNAGFFEFYSRLFLQAGFEALKADNALKTEHELATSQSQNTEADQPDTTTETATTPIFSSFQDFQTQLGITNISTIINDTQTIYSFTIPPDSLSQSLELLSYAVKAPLFKSDYLTNEAKAFASEMEMYQTSLAGFVTGAVETRISPAFPWKTTSGTNPSVFKKASTSKLRAITDEVRTGWYVPDNSELSVSGQIDTTAFINTAEKSLGDWKVGSVQFATFRNNQAIDTDKTLISTPFPSGKKYLLMSRGLSSQLLQLIIVYDNSFFAQNGDTIDYSDEFLQTISFIMNQNSSDFKTKAVASSSLNISSPYDINISTRSDTGIRRIVVQALLNPTEDSTIDAQTIEFIKLFEESFKLTLTNVIASRPNNNSTPNTDNSDSGEVQAFDINELTIEKPLTFIALNTDLYTAQKKTFTKNNWLTVTEKDAYWFNMKEYKSVLSSSGSSFSDTTNNGVANKGTNSETLTSAQKYVTINAPLFSSFILSNGIPVYTKYQTSDTTAVIIELTTSDTTVKSIEPDEQTPSKLGVFSAVLEIFASWIQAATGCFVQTEVTPLLPNQSSIYQGTLSFNCPNDYTQTALQRAIDSLVFGQITPVEADEIIYTLQSDHVQQTGTSDGRLKKAAFLELFGDTSVTQQMDITSSLYAGIKYNDILSLITELLDASCYRLVLCGGDNDFQSKVEPFALLKSNSLRLNREQEQKPVQSLKSRIASSVLKGPETLKSSTMLERSNGFEQIELWFGDSKLTEKQEMHEIFVPIRRVYISTMPVDKTEKKNEVHQPLELKETTVFYDPVHFYLKVPNLISSKVSTEQVAFDVLVTELESVISEQLNKTFPTTSLRNPTVSIEYICIPKENSFPESYIAVKFTDVKDYKVIKQLFRSSLDTVIASCKSISIKDLQTLKNRAIVSKLAATSTVEGTAFLMLENLQLTGKTSGYLDWYDELEKTTGITLHSIAEEYFNNSNVLALFIKSAE